jgi:Mrp family chromosome partitioning ATPase
MYQQFAGNSSILALMAATLILAAFLLRAIRRQQAERVVGHISEMTEGADLFLMSSLPRYPGDERWLAGLPAEAGQQMGQPLHILFGNLRWALHPSPRTRLLITSPGIGEGTSFVAANLAIYIAMSGSKVLLVDANRSRRVLHKWFRLDDGLGLADLAEEWRAMASPADEEHDRLIMRYARPTRVNNLFLLTGGYGSSDPGSDPLAGLPEELVEQFDAVLLDAPSHHEAGSLWKLPFWHDVLLVSMVGRTRIQGIRHTVRRLQAAQIRTLGVVANCVPEEQMLWVGRVDAGEAPLEIADAPPIPAPVTVSRANATVRQSSEPDEQSGEMLTAIAVDALHDVSVQALRDEVAYLNACLAEQQAKSETWAGKAQELETQLSLLLNEKAGENSAIEHIRAQVDLQQREIGRLKTVTAEYRQILAHKEALLQEYMLELTAAQALLKRQRERLEFMQQSGNISESAPEKAISNKPSGDISAD